MKNVVLFPGLAADRRLFSQLTIENFPVRIIEFLSPEKNESISRYAQRIAASIPPGDHTVFIGVSFGGILAQEVARFYEVEKIVLISSISSKNQLPFQFSVFKVFPVYDWLSEKQLKELVMWVSERFTIKNKKDRALFESMVWDADIRLIRWGIRQTLRWQQEMPASDITHIHGSLDRLFPIKHIPADYTIESGAHFMVIQQAKEISEVLNGILEA